VPPVFAPFLRKKERAATHRDKFIAIDADYKTPWIAKKTECARAAEFSAAFVLTLPISA